MKLRTDIEEMNTRGLTSVTLYAMVKHIELWLTDNLVPFARNPRTHSDLQVAQIAASIAGFGFNNPILVDTTSGIIAGHEPFLAARKLGLTEVPVIVLDHLTEAQKARIHHRGYPTGAGCRGWDEDLLRSELAALRDENFDVNLIVRGRQASTTSQRQQRWGADRRRHHSRGAGDPGDEPPRRSGSTTTQGRPSARAIAAGRVAFPFCLQGRVLVFRSSIPGPPMPLSTLRPRQSRRSANQSEEHTSELQSR